MIELKVREAFVCGLCCCFKNVSYSVFSATKHYLSHIDNMGKGEEEAMDLELERVIAFIWSLEPKETKELIKV